MAAISARSFSSSASTSALPVSSAESLASFSDTSAASGLQLSQRPHGQRRTRGQQLLIKDHAVGGLDTLGIGARQPVETWKSSRTAVSASNCVIGLWLCTAMLPSFLMATVLVKTAGPTAVLKSAHAAARQDDPDRGASAPCHM